jgi:hypothetical protein
MLVEKNYERVMDLRGRAFREMLNLYLRIRQHHQDEAKPEVGVWPWWRCRGPCARCGPTAARAG